MKVVLKGSPRLFDITLAALTLLVCTVGQAFDIKDGTSPTLPGAGPKSGGFQLLAVLEKPTVAVGEKVVLKLTLQNVSNEDHSFGNSNPRTEFKLTVTDERGHGVPGNANLYGGAITNSYFVIKPGGQVLEDYTVNSVFADDIRKPGHYRITARTYLLGKTNDSPKPVVVSNTVELNVVEPKPEQHPKEEADERS